MSTLVSIVALSLIGTFVIVVTNAIENYDPKKNRRH